MEGEHILHDPFNPQGALEEGKSSKNSRCHVSGGPGGSYLCVMEDTGENILSI